MELTLFKRGYTRGGSASRNEIVKLEDTAYGFSELSLR